MGAINYGKNREFGLTIGYALNKRIYNPTEQDLKDWDCESVEEYERSFYYNIETCYDEISWLLEKQRFDYFNVKLEAGYYEGFWISIDFKYLYLDCYKDKLEALKETTRLKKFLLDCIQNYDCVGVEDWWVATWYNYKDTIKALNSAIREQKAKIKAMKTDKTLTREEWRKLVGIGG